MGDTPRYSAEVLEEFFFVCSGTTMIAGILMTMRLIAEERQTATMTLLDTAPISEAQIVIEERRKHYNTVRPHSALGYRPPAPEVIIPLDRRPSMH